MSCLTEDDEVDTNSLSFLAVHALTFPILDAETREPTQAEFLAAQSQNACCCQTLKTVGMPGSFFSFHGNSYLIRKSQIDDAIQKVVTTSLQLRILYHFHFPRLAGHADERRSTTTCDKSFIGRT